MASINELLSFNWMTFWAAVIFVVALTIMVASTRRRPVLFEELSEKVTAMSSRLEVLTIRVADLELMLSEYRVGTAKLTAQIVDLGHEPVWKPAMIPVTPRIRRALLYQAIADAFNMEEMGDLAANAGIASESFSGETRTARALSLVEFADRHGLLPELVKVCRELRPRTAWPVDV